MATSSNYRITDSTKPWSNDGTVDQSHDIHKQLSHVSFIAISIKSLLALADISLHTRLSKGIAAKLLSVLLNEGVFYYL